MNLLLSAAKLLLKLDIRFFVYFSDVVKSLLRVLVATTLSQLTVYENKVGVEKIELQSDRASA